VASASPRARSARLFEYPRGPRRDRHGLSALTVEIGSARRGGLRRRTLQTLRGVVSGGRSGVRKHEALAGRALVRVRVIPEECVHHEGRRARRIARQDRDRGLRHAHAIELRPMTRQVEHVVRMRDAKRVDPGARHPLAGARQVDGRRLAQE
jgi:hypothetical protein